MTTPEEDLAKAMTSPSGSSKKCWSCDAVTPYEVGWCEACYAKIPPDIIAALDIISTEPLAGAIRLVIADNISALNRITPSQLERQELKRKIKEGLYVPADLQKRLKAYGQEPQKAVTKLNLDDLDI